MLSLFGFGKKRRKSSRKVSKKVSRKPSKKVLKMCKKLKIKCTVKRGSKRTYKSSKVLMKAIKKKLRMLKKSKVSKKSRKGSKKTRKSSKRFSFGSSCGAGKSKEMYFGASKKRISFGRSMGNEFGKGRKRKGTMKVSKAAAMKAFKAFYRRHCSSSVRGNRFGNGGNPRLSETMGYEFPELLGPRSTGLFPTPSDPMMGMGGTNPRSKWSPVNITSFGARRKMRKGKMMAGSHMMPDGSMMPGASHMQIGARRRKMMRGMY